MKPMPKNPFLRIRKAKYPHFVKSAGEKAIAWRSRIDFNALERNQTFLERTFGKALDKFWRTGLGFFRIEGSMKAHPPFTREQIVEERKRLGKKD